MSRHNAKAIFRTYVRLANVSPSVTLHSLRHYRGTVLMRTTGDLEFTREQLRHSDARSVQTYLHTDPERRDRYLRQLERQDAAGGADA
jgi:integrase